MIVADPHPSETTVLCGFLSPPTDRPLISPRFVTPPIRPTWPRLAVADAFRTARPNDPGFTFGQHENLLNVTSSLSHRIDLVQFREPFTVEDVQVVGASPADRTRLGLWPSDHAGVVATLTLRSRDDAH